MAKSNFTMNFFDVKLKEMKESKLWKPTDNEGHYTDSKGKRTYRADLFSPLMCSQNALHPPLEEKADAPFWGSEDNWQEFWRICKKHFPKFSVHGGGASVKDILRKEADDIYGKVGQMMRISGVPFILEGKKVLEIGYGYGGSGLEMLSRGADYYGIDYYSSNRSLLEKKFGDKKRFFEIKTSGIPGFLMNQKYDIVYSINVMQHLTTEQKYDYFRQISKVLKKSGVFVFDCCEWNEKEMGETVREDYNTKFFGVKTTVETPEELNAMFSNAGLKVLNKAFNYTPKGETASRIYILKKQ